MVEKNDQKMSNVNMQAIEDENEAFPLFKTISKPLVISDFKTVFSES